MNGTRAFIIIRCENNSEIDSIVSNPKRAERKAYLKPTIHARGSLLVSPKQ